MTRRLLLLVVLGIAAILAARAYYRPVFQTTCFGEYTQWYTEHRCHSGPDGMTVCEIP